MWGMMNIHHTSHFQKTRILLGYIPALLFSGHAAAMNAGVIPGFRYNDINQEPG